MDDADLIEFVRSRQQALVRRAYLLTGDLGLAEDLVQDCLAKLWLARKRPIENPDAYLRKVMTHAAISIWRRKRPRELMTGTVRDSHESDPADAFGEHDRVWQGLLRLPPQQRAIIVLRFYEDLAEAEICAVLDIAPGTVRSQTSKARTKLRTLIGDNEGASS